MGEIVRMEPLAQHEIEIVMAMSEQMKSMMPAMAEQMKNLAVMMRGINERMGALEREVRRLTKVTPSQANTLNAAIRSRAANVCRMHHCEGSERAAAAAIRMSVRATLGVTSMRDVPRDDFKVGMRAIELWDDYQVMRRIRERGQKDE